MNNSEIRAFAKQWNDGVKVELLATKYKLTTSQVRSRVAEWRKKGVKLVSRRVKQTRLDAKDVAEINRGL